MSAVTISVLFTDLVGSTELSSRVGPARTEELRVAHFAALREALASHEGTEVKNLGDGLMVAFGSLGHALDGAVAMQQAMARHNAKGGEQLEIRIGLSTGDATEEDGDYFGDPVVEAARLNANAGPGQILVPEIVCTLSRRTAHAYASVGDLELKGMPEPVAAYELLWEPLVVTSAVPLPARLSTPPPTALCGRDGERDALAEHWKAAKQGERRIALLSGEAGMGKTRLSTEAALAAHADGATVLYGRCDEEIGLPYQPFVEAIGHYVAHAPQAVLDAHVARHGGDVARLAPGLAQRVASDAPAPSNDQASERYVLLSAVTGLFAEAAADSPILLVLDDLHWADKPTLLLLQHLAKASDTMALLVIGTYRDTDLGAGHPLVDVLADLRRETGVDRIALAGLDDHGILGLMEQLAGHEMDAAGIGLAQAVRRETDGNPFFTGEILRHLAETGVIRQDEQGRWSASRDLDQVGLPDSVREVVGRRIRRLSAGTYRALSVAAVIGRDFDLATLCAVDDANEDEVLDALEEAEQAFVVAEVAGVPGRFTFLHALIQHTLYDELSGARRARTHRRIGEVLEASLGAHPGERIGELAHHWLSATVPSDAAKAVDYARQAGEQALSKLAPHEAVRWFTAGLELLAHQPHSDEPTRCELLVGLGEAQRQAGDPVSRETLLAAAELADRLGDAERLVRAALANQRGVPSSFGEVDDDRVRVLRRALEIVGPEPSSHRASLLALLANELCFARDLAGRLAVAAEARAIADQLGDPAVLVQVLNLTFLSCWIPGRVEESLASTALALEVADQVGDPIALGWAAIFRFNATISGSDPAGMAAAHELARSLSGETGQPALVWFAEYLTALRVLVSGDADLAEELATAALQTGSDGGQLDAFVVFGAQLIAIRWHQGRLNELVDLLTQSVADNPGIPAFAGALGIALCHAGQLDEARALLAKAMAADYYGELTDYIWATMMCTFAETIYLVEDEEAAALVYERILPFESQGVTSVATHAGVVGAYAAQLATILRRYDEAEQLFADADTRLREMQAPFWIGRNGAAWARMLLDRGDAADVERAITMLTESAAISRDYGCARLATECQHLLERIG
jgi:class 3 adenylate cyclase/tetratricopeptide (TPR) repeat protein